jgi:DNA polymerase elongation subunit (family B)/DNA-directed RNA polymerase subunit RPC12/RpoP
MKILLLDIETAPHVAYIWNLFDQIVTIERVIKPGYTLCWSAKWYGERGIIFDSIPKSGFKTMIRNIHKLLDEADVVIHFNGSKFDIPVLNKEFVKMGLQPPSPFKQIDLYRVVRARFKFASNKLDFVVKELGLGNKIQHKGMDLWKECMSNDPKAWVQMERYNIRDVTLLQSLYDHIKGWIVNHPNMGVYDPDGSIKCRTCGSHSLVKKGYEYTSVGRYQRYKCKDCGAPNHGRINLLEKEDRANILV